ARPLPPHGDFVRDGFEVQHLYDVPLQAQGSWVSLAVGPDGSLYASDQEEAGIFRIQVGGTTDAPQVQVARVPVNVSGAQGMVWAFDSLYANVNGTGLYRIRDTNGDSQPDTPQLLGISDGGGEHGVHDVLLTEDGQGLYFVAGNSSPMTGFTSSTLTNWREDLLLPREWDARGHARGRMAPGGYILRINPDATERKVVSVGYRNAYGAALNAHGELFTYDSDLEYDMGSPWYRPTRINHVVSGSEFGWRSGTGKWKPYYEDSLPAVLDIGPGSPTGVIAGLGAKFPARYQHAIFALDWTYSTIYAVHLTPSGASYRAEMEEFVAGAPLTVTDAVIGRDGLMYFAVGGRGTESKLYRVVYRGAESTAPAPAPDTAEARGARELRRRLESFHGRQDANAVATAWPHLSSPDRFLRYAARVAVEWQPIDTWMPRAVTEVNPQARISAIVALARNGTSRHREAATKALLELDMARLTADQKIGMARAFALVFIRLGDPTAAERTQIVRALHRLLPDAGRDDRVNVELVRTLIYLRDDQVTAKAMALVRDRGPAQPPAWSPAKLKRSERYGGNPLALVENPTPAVEIEYAFMLRTHREGWTTPLRREYFQFLNVAADRRGGASYGLMLEDTRAEALRNSTPADRAAVADLTGRSFVATPDFEIRPPMGPGRAWTIPEASKVVAPAQMTGRNFDRGRSLYFAVGCGSCHRLNEYGGDTGPDLTTVSVRFNANRILEKIIDPNRIISDQYLSSEVRLTSGQTLVGLVVESGDTITVHPRDPKQEATAVPRSQVAAIELLKVSLMPPGLINSLSDEELRDFMAYLQSGGNREHRFFQPAGAAPPGQ
ncbi:MAG: c-type cytochrome, partial [Acidobacteria bacterium]|nr:c-type cytochrome [Acidobacteriota bacterium]